MGKKQNLIDNNLYREMWNFAQASFIGHGMKKREISDYFEDYSLKLPFLFRFVFRCSKIGIRLISFASERVAVATITMMEKPKGSSYFSDFAFFFRPCADLRAPFLDSDALDPLAGVKGMFEMNVYNCNHADVNLDEFFGDNISKIKEALEIVKPYRKTPEQGRGKYTAYLEPYLNEYCIELHQPDAGDVAALKRFYQDELRAFKFYLEAYLSSLTRLTPEKGIVENNKIGFEKFIKEVVENDFAAKMGGKIFKDDFQKYFYEGCWRIGYYGEDIT